MNAAGYQHFVHVSVPVLVAVMAILRFGPRGVSRLVFFLYFPIGFTFPNQDKSGPLNFLQADASVTFCIRAVCPMDCKMQKGNYVIFRCECVQYRPLLSGSTPPP